MNTEIKVLLSITMQGGKLYKSSSNTAIPFVVRKKDYYKPGQKLPKDADKVVKSGKRRIYTLTQSTCTLQTKICKDAYNFMISDTCPNWFRNPKEWKKLSPIVKLEAHLSRMCDAVNGISYTYSIIDD